MNFSKQLKKYREINKFSQEVLAEKIFVTRQTISKWENDKSYPDIHNLVALSILFDISLDELVKGDVDTMKDTIASKRMDQDSKKMLLFLVLALIIGVPSMSIFSWWGFIPFVTLWGIAMIFAFRIEKTKKKYDIKTYKEIISFTEGHSNLDEIRLQRNQKKDIRAKILIILGFVLAGGILTFVISMLTEVFTNH
ncbi:MULTISPECIES: helix-turn-helix domain-containing protein [Enterococcus]|uniref:Helix-turn-helix domain-containing protein n=1 Tax=Enterococcus alishanensis TaxID=1303817 RepID=A0ABS6TBX1_9ENTE|nr:helix-turn-helix transcriptional regulator [Enterococcus alishanensis]MBV7390392.1 helix-turn-helix domain-containing protein [Enterococcus alishanensis]